MLLHKLSLSFIKTSFFIAVWVINRFIRHVDTSLIERLEKLQADTVGANIVTCLHENNLKLVPYFESHDLKHILFDYKMTALDEIRLQACMLGNGNWSIPSMAIFLFGAILLPSQWLVFYQDFKKGRAALPIKEWTIEEYASRNLAELKSQMLNHNSARQPFLISAKPNRLASFSMIIAGASGMIYCLPYLFSSNIADLVGAGFPFIAGSVLIVGGFINLSIIANRSLLDRRLI